MSLSVVQFASGSQLTGTGVPGQPLLGSNPTVDNLLICILHTDSASTGVTVNTSAWTQLGDNIVSFTYVGNSYAVARYVQPGDLALLPAMATAGACHWAYAIWEVSGVSGNLAADLQTVGGCSYVQASSHGPLAIYGNDQVPQGIGTLGLYSCAVSANVGVVYSTPSGWTADVATDSLTNWGGLGGFHIVNPSPGTAINGTPPNYSSSNVSSAMQIILQSTPPAGPYIRSTYCDDPSSQFSGGGETTLTGTLQTAPVPGNLVIAIINSTGWNTNTLTADPFWNVGAVLTSGGKDYAFLLYRYAQSGDTVALTRFFSNNTGGSQEWGYSTLEIGHVSGIWANDFQSAQSGYQASGSSLLTGTGTTAEDNTLVIIGVGQTIDNIVNGVPTLDSGFTNFDGFYGGAGIFAGSQTFPTSGSSVSSTIGAPGSMPICYIQALFGAAPSTGHIGWLNLIGCGN